MLLTWIRGLSLVYASLVKGPQRNGAFCYPIKSPLFVDADDPKRSAFFWPYLWKEILAEQNATREGGSFALSANDLR